MSRRVLVLGLDACEPRLLFEGVKSGFLPAISSLLNGARVSHLESDGGVENLGQWASMLSGMPVGDHGFYELWGWDATHYQVTRYDPDRDFPFDPFWVALGASGRRVIVIDWPRAPVRCGPNVDHVSDWIQHYRTEPTRATSPALLRQVKSRYWVQGRGGDMDEMLTSGIPIPAALDKVRERLETKVGFAERRLRDEPWDVFMVCFAEAHDIGHRCWSIHDTAHPEHDPELAERIGDPVWTCYRWLDEAVGRLRLAAGDDAVIVLSTGPGMEANYSGNGLLDYFLTRLYGVDSSRFIERPCFELRNHPRSGAIRFNLKGRESAGRIDPAEYDRFRDNLIAHLMVLENIDTGSPVVERVISSKETYPGERSDLLPDLFVLWNRSEFIYGFNSPTAGRMDFGSFRTLWSGDHSLRAILVVAGRSIDPAWTISRFEQFPDLVGRILDVSSA